MAIYRIRREPVHIGHLSHLHAEDPGDPAAVQLKNAKSVEQEASKMQPQLTVKGPKTHRKVLHVHLCWKAKETGNQCSNAVVNTRAPPRKDHFFFSSLFHPNYKPVEECHPL